MSVRLPHPRFGLDSTSGVPVAAHRQAGSSFALRYLSRYDWKVLREDELRAYRANGISIGVVFEDGAANALGGYDRGRADAEFALGQARALGIPARRPIFFAVDFDTGRNPAATDGYFDGVASVLGRDFSGPYGGFGVVQRQLDRGFRWAWQTYAWSGAEVDCRAQLYQFSNAHVVGGVGVDFNHAFYADFGQWDGAPGPVPDPDPYHYAWYPEGPFAWDNKLLYERWLVQQYDHYRIAPHLGASSELLALLEEDLALARKRVWWEAHVDPATGQRLNKPRWDANKLGFRWQGLLARSRGQRVA